jgi:hypothetical protein
MLVTIGKNLDALKLIRAHVPSNLNPLRFDSKVYPLASELGNQVLTKLRRGVRKRRAAGFSYEQYSLTCFAKQWYL